MWSVHTNLFGHQIIANLLNSGEKDQQEEDSQCQLEFYRFHCWHLILVKKMVIIMVIVIIMNLALSPLAGDQLSAENTIVSEGQTRSCRSCCPPCPFCFRAKMHIHRRRHSV